MRLRTRLRCFLAGHPLTITVVEKINDAPWAVQETCACGQRSSDLLPGALVKEHAEAYAQYPTEWKEFF